jgi:hypothetical protein
MSLARCLLVALGLIAALGGCAVDVGVGGANSAVPRCDRNGDAEQRIACVR